MVTKAVEAMEAAASVATATSPEGWTEELVGRWARTDWHCLRFLLEVQACSGACRFFLPAVALTERRIGQGWVATQGRMGVAAVL